MLVGECLASDAFDVGDERHRRRAEVGAVFRNFLARSRPDAGELIDVIVHHRRALVGHQPILLHRLQQRIDEAERQPHMLGEIPARRFRAAIECLEQQVLDFGRREACFRK